MLRHGPPTSAASAGQARRHIVFVAFPDVQVLDVTGPLEVFGRAARLLVERGLRRDLAYTVEIVAADGGAARDLLRHRDRRRRRFRDRPPRRRHAARGRRPRRATPRRRTRAARVAGAHGAARPAVGSVCTGTFILAAAGLLDGGARRRTGRRATRWRSSTRGSRRARSDLRARRPRSTRRPASRPAWTGAGARRGGLRTHVALGVARQLVLFLRRPGGQSQFSAQLAVQTADREPLRELQSGSPIICRPTCRCRRWLSASR